MISLCIKNNVITTKRPVPHQTGDSFTVTNVFIVGQGFIQSHSEQMYTVIECSDEKIDLNKVNVIILVSNSNHNIIILIII